MPPIRFPALLLVCLAVLAGAPRPPRVPLVVHDPYFSLWSPSEQAAGAATRHWTTQVKRLTGLLRVDGRIFRVLGDQPADLPVLPQTSLQVLPTRTVYHFQDAAVQVTLTFLTPVLPDDLEALARPLTYAIWDVASADGKGHTVDVGLALGDEIAVNDPAQPVAAAVADLPGLVAARVGSRAQPVLVNACDECAIDWGQGWLAAPGTGAVAAHGGFRALVQAFAEGGALAAPPEGAADRDALMVRQSLGAVTAQRTCFQMVAYDEGYALRYLGRDLKPWWKRAGAEMPELLAAAVRDFTGLRTRCAAFDAELCADAERLGGPGYAYLCALAYRQCLGACGLAADGRGAPLMMPKENSSNGCIATIDVHFPMLPQFLLFFPSLAKATLVPPLDYAASPAWKYPYAPHDLGTYPRADGQVYGMDGTDADRMPVEESGNLLLMVAAVCQVDGNAHFAARWWPQLTAWAGYLERQGFDPANQLCTDDFAGHLAHNANLSVKAILALAAYGRMAEMRGDAPTAARYRDLARDFARKWMLAADDGDHYRLAFDKPGTWSQKYNLVWDRILGLGIFPAEVAEREMAFYRKHFNTYGLPLDSRHPQAKADWEVWTGTLTGRRKDLEAFVAPLCAFYDQVPERFPMTDWYSTTKGHMIGFIARPVVGGMFLPFLYDRDLWRKWAGRDRANPGNHIWAEPPVPRPPQ